MRTTLDTVPPNVPETAAPANGAVVKQARFTGAFKSSDAGDGGTVAFEVCANAACTIVLGRGVSASIAAGVVASGVSTSVGTGTTVSWTATDLPNGSYFWRARARDDAGNVSDWSPTQSFTLERTPPGKPRGFSATTTEHTLTIRWQPPADTPSVAGYALLVNGRRIVTLDAKTLVVRVALQDGEKRSFAIAAIDEAGNVGAPNAAFLLPAQPATKQARKTAAPKAPVKKHRRK